MCAQLVSEIAKLASDLLSSQAACSFILHHWALICSYAPAPEPSKKTRSGRSQLRQCNRIHRTQPKSVNKRRKQPADCFINRKHEASSCCTRSLEKFNKEPREVYNVAIVSTAQDTSPSIIRYNVSITWVSPEYHMSITWGPPRYHVKSGSPGCDDSEVEGACLCRQERDWSFKSN
jgi:hypothetical protein